MLRDEYHILDTEASQLITPGKSSLLNSGRRTTIATSLEASIVFSRVTLIPNFLLQNRLLCLTIYLGTLIKVARGHDNSDTTQLNRLLRLRGWRNSLLEPVQELFSPLAVIVSNAGMDQDLSLKRLADLNRGRIGEEVLVVEDDHKVSLLGDSGEVLDVGSATISHHVELRGMGDDAHAESLGEDASLVATDLVGFDSEQPQGLVADLVAVGVVLVPDPVMSLARAAEELTGEDDGQREAELTDSIGRRSRVQCQDRDL